MLAVSRTLCNMWAKHVSGKATVVEMYDALVKKRVLRLDAEQRAMAEQCTPLIKIITSTPAQPLGSQREVRSGATPALPPGPHGRSPESTSPAASSALSRIWGAASRLRPASWHSASTTAVEVKWPQNLGVQAQQGLYIWGGVGIGKTMIMDLFDLCPMDPHAKRRVHLHSFMCELSDRLHAATMAQMALPKGSPRMCPIDVVVDEVLAESQVMCFDEFQTFDVAHAALLAAFFSRALQRGMFLVATSNRPPEELCHVSRAFDELVPLIYAHCSVYKCPSPTDYRKSLSAMHHQALFPCPNTNESARNLLQRLGRGFASDLRKPAPPEGGVDDGVSTILWERHCVLWLYGRPLIVPYRCGGVAVFDFSELFGVKQKLGPPDYQLLARTFHTIMVTNVPQIGVISKNIAHLFIVFIDEIYQLNVKLLLTCQVPWDHLLDDTAYWDGTKPDLHAENYYTDNADERTGFSTSFAFSNMEETLSFERIASRLHEMGMEHYLLRDHGHFVVTDFRLPALFEA